MTQFSMSYVDCEATINSWLMSAELTDRLLSQIYEAEPDLAESQTLTDMLTGDRPAHIFVLIYQKNGEKRRRIAALTQYNKGDERAILEQLAESLGVKIERYLYAVDKVPPMVGVT